jgi:propanol-preferring alcohol dehydrogenase
MKAMVLEGAGLPLRLRELPDRVPGEDQLRVRVEACGVCRTDLHLLDGELPAIPYPVIPGHEIVGIVDAVGENVGDFRIGDRVGIPWLGRTCGVCPFCRDGRENLCDRPLFTGYTRDGGYATHTICDARFSFHLPGSRAAAEIAPLLCAGLIGWRSLKLAGEGKALGIYGFGAAGHIVAQVARFQKRDVHAITRRGNEPAQQLALQLGAVWAGAAEDVAPQSLDAAIIFAPAGELVPAALRAVRKGGRVVCGGIHMSDVPSFPYALLWQERQLLSVANLTRDDGREFFDIARRAGISTHSQVFPLEQANEVLTRLRGGGMLGAAVLLPPA